VLERGKRGKGGGGGKERETSREKLKPVKKEESVPVLHINYFTRHLTSWLDDHTDDTEPRASDILT